MPSSPLGGKATRIVRSLPGGGAYRKVAESAELNGVSQPEHDLNVLR
jgi:hypothetical protein